jgi:hypothetical protein
MSFRSIAAVAFLCVLFILCFTGCGSDTSDGSTEDQQLSVRDLESYGFNPSTALIDRVQTVPDFYMTYMKDLYSNEDFTAYTPSQTELDEIREYLSLLPDSYLSTMQQRLVAIYFVNNMTWTGFTDYVLDSENNVYTIIVINPETMKHDASYWLTYKENTCFVNNGTEDEGISVTIDCGTEYLAMMPVLIHEASHVMDYVNHYTPYVSVAMRELGLYVSETAFVEGIWSGIDTPVTEYDFSMRNKISYYGLGSGAQIAYSQASEVYQELEKTPFVSLYGSQNWTEDFGEYCMWQYFTQYLNQPYRIIVQKGDTVDFVYEPMESEIVQERSEALATLFE